MPLPLMQKISAKSKKSLRNFWWNITEVSLHALIVRERNTILFKTYNYCIFIWLTLFYIHHLLQVLNILLHTSQWCLKLQGWVTFNLTNLTSNNKVNLKYSNKQKIITYKCHFYRTRSLTLLPVIKTFKKKK